MGVDITVWRARIGWFICRSRRIKHFKVITLNNHTRKSMSLILRVITCMAVLILLCGDVETNPGPPKQDGTRNKSQYKRAAGTQDLGDQNGEGPTPRRTIQEGVATTGTFTKKIVYILYIYTSDTTVKKIN